MTAFALTLQMEFLVQDDLHLIAPEFMSAEVVPGAGKVAVTSFPFLHETIEHMRMEITPDTITLLTGNDKIMAEPTATI
jgi:hypothetical protein